MNLHVLLTTLVSLKLILFSVCICVCIFLYSKLKKKNSNYGSGLRPKQENVDSCHVKRNLRQCFIITLTLTALMCLYVSQIQYMCINYMSVWAETSLLEPAASCSLGWRTAWRRWRAACSRAAAGVCSPAWAAAGSLPPAGVCSPPAAAGNP